MSEKEKKAKKIKDPNAPKKPKWPVVLTVLSIAFLLILAVGILTMKFDFNVKVSLPKSDAPVASAQTEAQTQAPAAPTEAPSAQPTENAAPADAPADAPTDAPAPSDGSLPQTKAEIVEKYTELCNNFKAQKPAYTRKEYQALPEEYRNFGSAVNLVLQFAGGYMTGEDDEKAIVTRAAGAEEILVDLPPCNSQKGCLLKEFDPTYACVKNESCTQLPDGNVELSFSLNEEVNCEPTAAGTDAPTCAHGAVMQPGSREDIMVEVHKVENTAKIVTCNSFDLTYRDCTFSCVYNPQTNQLVSITHHSNIDIAANVKVAFSTIDGTARLTDDMLIYDIVW